MQSWTPDSPLLRALEQIRLVYPPAAVVHVGAGDGSDLPPYAHWAIASVILIEANDHPASALAKACGGRPGWQALHAMAGAKRGPAVFHLASNPRESGSLPPETWQPLWRNLRCVESWQVEQTTLDAVLGLGPSGGPAISPQSNWLIVDCLPALPVLQGAVALIDTADVVVVRTVADPQLQMPGAGREDIDAFLQQAGFRPALLSSELHPAVAMAVYCRDWKTLYAHRAAASVPSADALAQSAREFEERSLLLALQMVEPRRQIADLRDALAARDALLADALAQLRQEADQRALREAQADEQGRHLEAAAGRIAALESELVRASEGISGLELDLSAARSQAAERITALEQDVAIGQAQVGRALDQYRGELRATQEQRARVVALEQSLEELARASEARVSDMTRLVSIHDEEQRTLQAALAQAQAREQAHEKALEASLSRSNASDARAGALEAAQVVQSGVLADLQQQLSASRHAVAEADAQVRAAVERGHQLESECGKRDELLVEQRRQTVHWKQCVDRMEAAAAEQAAAGAALSQQAAELAAQLEQLRQAHAALSQAHDVHERVSRERLAQIEAQNLAARAHEQRVAQLEQTRTELDARQRLLDQEILKAEAQIELIKDVVLREKAF